MAPKRQEEGSALCRRRRAIEVVTSVWMMQQVAGCDLTAITLGTSLTLTGYLSHT
jgi:hypothetical protein